MWKGTFFFSPSCQPNPEDGQSLWQESQLSLLVKAVKRKTQSWHEGSRKKKTCALISNKAFIT